MQPQDVFSGAFVGEGTLLVQCAEVFLKAGHRVSLVVTANPVIQDWADEWQIPCVSDVGELAAKLEATPVDYLFSVANLRVIPDAVLRLPRNMSINFHDALLPRYAGLRATSWALINREPTHGVTWHEMLAEVDRGRILKQRVFPITPGETAVTLNAKCYETAVATFGELVDELATDRLAPQEQQHELRTYFARNQRPDAACTIDWRRPAEDIAALVAALAFGPTENPLGLAKIELGDGSVIIARDAQVLSTTSAGSAAGVVVGTEGDALRVTTGTADIALRNLHTVDGSPLSASDLAERFGVRVGSRLHSLTDARAAALSKLHQQVANDEGYWVKRLATLRPIELPYGRRAASQAS
jgi:methionyl-tRNA formyltransferase